MLLCQGLVDLEKEIAKCDKKLDLAQLNLQKIIKVVSQPDYETTLPENVRLANEEKVCSCYSFDLRLGIDFLSSLSRKRH
jgi:valyl-tRNA synthetase